MSEGNGTSDYVLVQLTASSPWTTRNGTILGLKKAITKDFDPTFAGTYKAILLPENRGANWPGQCSDGYYRLEQRDHCHSADT
jgi:hypothetical protein